MASMQDDQGDDSLPQPATSDSAEDSPLPAAHGQVHSSSGDPAAVKNLRAHLAEIAGHANTTSRWNGHGMTHGPSGAATSRNPASWDSAASVQDAASEQNGPYDGT
jgi:hypothetical protein